MATYLFYANAEHKRRADGRNTVIAVGADAAVARVAAEAIVGDPGCLASFTAVLLDATCPPCVIEGCAPVGSIGQTVWPTITRGGDRLKAA